MRLIRAPHLILFGTLSAHAAEPPRSWCELAIETRSFPGLLLRQKLTLPPGAVVEILDPGKRTIDFVAPDELQTWAGQNSTQVQWKAVGPRARLEALGREVRRARGQLAQAERLQNLASSGDPSSLSLSAISQDATRQAIFRAALEGAIVLVQTKTGLQPHSPFEIQAEDLDPVVFLTEHASITVSPVTSVDASVYADQKAERLIRLLELQYSLARILDPDLPAVAEKKRARYQLARDLFLLSQNREVPEMIEAASTPEAGRFLRAHFRDKHDEFFAALKEEAMRPFLAAVRDTLGEGAQISVTGQAPGQIFRSILARGAVGQFIGLVENARLREALATAALEGQLLRLSHRGEAITVSPHEVDSIPAMFFNDRSPVKVDPGTLMRRRRGELQITLEAALPASGGA